MTETDQTKKTRFEKIARELAAELSELTRKDGYTVYADIQIDPSSRKCNAYLSLAPAWSAEPRWDIGFLCEGPVSEGLDPELAYEELLSKFGSRFSWDVFLASSLTRLSFPGASSAEELRLKLAAIGEWNVVRR